jgi:hypothetical protein
MRTEPWIAALKPGDKVIERRYSYGTFTRDVRAVERLTSSGRVVLQDVARTYNPDGSVRGRTSSYQSYNLEACTPEAEGAVIDANDQARLAVRLRYEVKWPDVPVQVLRELAAILDRPEPAA